MTRGVIPYGRGAYHPTEEPWGHIDLLEEHYGKNWPEEIKKTSQWKRLLAGEHLTGNTGSVNWAICTEFDIQNPDKKEEAKCAAR